MTTPELDDLWCLMSVFLVFFLGLIIVHKTFFGGKKKVLEESYEKNSVARGGVEEEVGAGSADVIIVGAGVAGAGAALTCALAKDGLRLHVIERDLTEPNRTAGELLQPGGYLKLLELDLADCVQEIDAQRIFGFVLYKDGKSTRILYPRQNFTSGIVGWGFRNGRFIQWMREKAATFPNVRLEQRTATSLIEEKGTVKGVKYKTKAGQAARAYAPLTIVCDGCFSNLRRALCHPKIDIPSYFVSLVLEKCDLPFPNHGHTIMADPSPILFYPISSDKVRCLVDIPNQKLPLVASGEMANYLKSVVVPQIPCEICPSFIAAIEKGNKRSMSNQSYVPCEICPSFIAAIEKGNIRSMSNQSMPASPKQTPGAHLLGGAFNMRHPLTGGGMTVALSDVIILRNLRRVSDLNDTAALCKSLESFYTLRKPMASTINMFAGALYKVFCASPDPARKEMRQACFDYLSLGGMCSSLPISLLSGLNPRPLVLVCHFFMVSIYGIGRMCFPFPSPERMLIGTRLISCEFGIIFPILKDEGLGRRPSPQQFLHTTDLPHAPVN